LRHVWLGTCHFRFVWRQTRSRFSELDAACGPLSCIFSSSWRPSLVVPLYPFSMSHEDHPYKTSYASQGAADSDFGGGLLYVPTSRAKSLDGFQYQLGGFIPNSESASASASAFVPQVVGMPCASLSSGKTIVPQRQVQFRPRMQPTTSIQIRLPDSSRDPYHDSCLAYECEYCRVSSSSWSSCASEW
jgi:hypothetical protein